MKVEKWVHTFTENYLYVLLLQTPLNSAEVHLHLQGTPENLIFFYKHLELGGEIYRVEETLLSYRYHPLATTFSVHE